jgi:TonB family protein
MMILAQVLLTFLLNACWQVALVGAFAMLCDWLLLGVAARARHVLWVAALVLAFLIPLLSCAYVMKSPSLQKQVTVNNSAGSFVKTRIISTDAEPIEAPPENISPIEIAGRRWWSSPLPVSERLALTVDGLLAIFLIFRVAKLFRAWRRTRVIVQGAYEYQFLEPVREVIQKCQRQIGVRKVRILCSSSVAVPITVGVFKPLIVLPELLLHRIEDELLTTAVGHELVHVARRDYLFNLIYEFIYLPLSFQPAAAFIRRRIKQTRELSCDEAVAAKLLSPEIYARSLVHLVGAIPQKRRLAADTTIGISESDNLEVRIMSLLRTRNLAPRRKRLLVVIAALLLIVPGIAANRFALAFEIARPAANQVINSPQIEQRTERERLEQAREQLQRAEQQLKEQMKTGPDAQKAEAEARLREAQQNLEIHERLVREFAQQKAESTALALQQLRETYERAKKDQPIDEAALKNLREQLTELEKLDTNTRQDALRAQLTQALNQNPQDEARIQELRQKLAETSKSVAQVDRKTRLIYHVEPEYPADAREKKIEGKVLLGFTVDHDGLPQSIRVIRSLYPSLDQAAIEAVRQWRFEPAMKNGEPVSMWLNVEVYFGQEPDQANQDQAERAKNQEREKTERARNLEREAEERAKNQNREAEERTKLRESDLTARASEQEREREERTREAESRAAGIAAAGWAKISMTQAIQIATSKYPGTVVQSRLFGEREDKVFYQITIAAGDGAKRTIKYVWVSAIDGSILKTE